MKNDAKKFQNKLKPKGEGGVGVGVWCNKPTNWCSQNATNQPKSTVELCYMCPRGLSRQQAVALNK